MESYELTNLAKGEPLFTGREIYETWRQNFAESIKPELEKSQIARIHSEQHSRHHWVD